MTLSARNKLRGEIEEIVLGDVMAHVVFALATTSSSASLPAVAPKN
jgi:molybdopterin-binding protein